MSKSAPLHLDANELQNLMAALESAVKHAPNSLQASAVLLPLAAKVQSVMQQVQQESVPATVPEPGPPANRAAARKERFPVPDDPNK